MIAPDLPVELKAALEAKLHGLSRSDAAQRSARISQTYRSGGSSAAIRTEADALTYALARMPATYAAVTASLNALCEVRPDFKPKNLLDIGAGPGTATWAAAETFASLIGFTSFSTPGGGGTASSSSPPSRIFFIFSRIRACCSRAGRG